jgi:F0F1-type ATP synthase membrane subunit b/b'
MIDISFFLLNIEEKIGGLFDFDGTLPLTIFQFIGLVFILEKILYNPLSKIETVRIENLKEKTQKAQSILNAANFLIELYNTEVLNIEKKITFLLKQDNLELKDHFQKQLVELNKNSINMIVEIEQDIHKKVTTLLENEKVKNASTNIAAIIINQIISK